VKKVDPASLPIVQGVLELLHQELGSEFIATFEGFGWHCISNNFDGLFDVAHQDLFKGVRTIFPEQRFTFGFIGDKGFELLRDKNLLHGKRVITVKT
jgi:hypothetical protein